MLVRKSEFIGELKYGESVVEIQGSFTEHSTLLLEESGKQTVKLFRFAECPEIFRGQECEIELLSVDRRKLTPNSHSVCVGESGRTALTLGSTDAIERLFYRADN